MRVAVYRTFTSEVELPDGMFTYDNEGKLSPAEVFDYIFDNDIVFDYAEELEAEREVILLEEG